MNTAASVSPTSALEINNLFSEPKVTVTDYPVQAGRSSGSELRNSSGYRRLTLREKVARQRSERENAESSAETGQERPSSHRWTKSTSVGVASFSPKNHHSPTTRSQSNDAITEERTVFGFKILKGSGSNPRANNNNNTSAGFTRHTSLRQPVRTTHHGSSNRLKDKSGIALFYEPKTTRVSESLAEGNDKGASHEGKSSVEEAGKKSRSVHNTSIEEVSSTEEIRQPGLQERASTSNKSDNKNLDRKTDREVDVEKTGEEKAEKLIIRAESLREGKSRLSEFRDKQRRGKLTRSLTNPEYEQSESVAAEKVKNISESLAEIRERIRERRKKREQLRKSQSLPETESPPQQRTEEIIKEHSRDRKGEIFGKHMEVGLSEDTKAKENSVKGSSLSALEYLEIEENSKIDKNTTATIMDRKGEEDILRNTGDEEVVTDTKSLHTYTEDKDVTIENTRVQKDFNTMDKDESKAISDEKESCDSKKTEPEEIPNKKEDTLLSKEKESTDAKPEVDTSLSNDANTATVPSEQIKSEVKKPTKRERRKRERYQRSKTMSAIMYNEITQDARRETQHKGHDTTAEKNGESLAIPSVLEMKKRFMENESATSKLPEPGLFYPGKTSGSTKSKAEGKDSSKDDTATSKRKSSGTRTKAYVARRHTMAVGTTFQNTAAAQQEDAKPTSTKGNNSSTTENPKTTKHAVEAKITVSRRHTLPSFTINIPDDKPRDDGHSSAGNTNEGGARLPVRRHTFCSETSLMVNRFNHVKPSESIETLRDTFSNGGAPLFNSATSSRNGSARSVQNAEGEKEKHRRRVLSDSSIQSQSRTAKTKAAEDGNVNKETSSGASLIRRHTIADRPSGGRENFEKDQHERQKFLEKFLATDDEIKGSKKNVTRNDESERTITRNDESERTITRNEEPERTITRNDEAMKGGEMSSHRKKEKEKMSVSKLRKLFLGGQVSTTEKKTKLRQRRAKTIAGGISPGIMKELDRDKGTDVISNKYVVTPDLYVTVTAPEEAKGEIKEQAVERPERRRRRSDLNPDNYLSPEEAEKGFVFNEEKSSQDKVSSDVKIPVNEDKNRSVKEDDNVEEKLISSDVIDLKAPMKSLPVCSTGRRRSGSESDMNKDSNAAIEDQCLDDYLSTIKTMAASPKPKRASPQKGKFTASQSLDQDDEETKPKQHLTVAKKNLSLHSWSTSDLDKIFQRGDGVTSSVSQVDMTSMDFDEISSSTTRLQSLTEGRVKARPKRTVSKSLNPMKSLMERTDVRTNTEEAEEENKSGFEKPKKRSNPRKKRSQLEPWRRHTLDPVALAALASREDFSRVSLRKTKGPGKEKDEYDGSLPVMLIQIKGRRQVQTRLVEPSLSSLNTGDCFILVTPKEIFCWIGMHANTIEKAKAVEIASKIQKRGDMNCKTGDVLYIDETKQGNTLAYRKFCKILEGDTSFPIEDAQLCPDDEFYEREMISTNKVYKLQEGDPPHLIPVTELCGYMPRIGILNTKEVFIFDFGSELYLWTGQQSLAGKRKVAFHLAEMLYKQQFDCDAVVSPIDPRRTRKRSASSKPAVYHDDDGKELRRPKWTLFARLHEKAETLLFQEKFFDWPDPTKIIKMKGHISSGEVVERPPPVELKPCDPSEMQKPAGNLEPVFLESTNLGRGLGTPNVEVNGEVKEGDLVTTMGMTVWLVTQNRHFVLPKPSEGHFHSGDGYVIRWVYFVAKNKIVRDKRGRIRPLTGRQRCAYFFWQGNECSVNEKGAAAIMAVELDEEHGPQVRVVEGKEPPHFLKLFNGAMVIHSGKRVRVNDEKDEFSDKSTVRMYCIRNEDTSEGCLVQVRRSASSLRSRSSFIVVDSEVGAIFLWHGCKTNEFHKQEAEKAAKLIIERRPIEMNLSGEKSVTLTEIKEGKEPDIFWTTVSGEKTSYLSLLKDPLEYDFCPRLFHMTSATGQFTSTEILCPTRYPGRTCPFPVLQDDLYTAPQPTIFLLDVGDELYVWEGWMPAEITKDKRGSAKRRWNKERKLTLQTALAYVEANNQLKKGAYVVQAGLEPLSFTNYFPFWNDRQSTAEIKELEGKKDVKKKRVEDALENFTQKYYSIQELTSDNPPDGVDPSKLETYLTDDEFQKIFEMSRDLFGQLPGWKQDILKKALGLF